MCRGKRLGYNNTNTCNSNSDRSHGSNSSNDSNTSNQHNKDIRANVDQRIKHMSYLSRIRDQQKMSHACLVAPVTQLARGRLSDAGYIYIYIYICIEGEREIDR